MAHRFSNVITDEDFDFLNLLFGAPTTESQKEKSLPVAFDSTDKDTSIMVAIPGLNKDQVKANFTHKDGKITLSVEALAESTFTNNGAKAIINLDDSYYSSDGVVSNLSNGILTITVPKKVIDKTDIPIDIE